MDDGSPEAPEPAPEPVPEPARGSRRRLAARALLLVTVLGVAALPAAYALERSLGGERVLGGVHVEGESLGGLGREQAELALRRLEERLRRDPLEVRVGGRTFSLDPASIELRVDAQAMLRAALQEGRGGGFAGDFGSWIARSVAPVELAAKIRVDLAALERVVAGWEREALALPFEGAVVVRDGAPSADPPRAGQRVARAGLDALPLALARAARAPLDLPLESLAPGTGAADVDAVVVEARRLVSAPVTLARDDASGAPVELSVGREELTRWLRSEPRRGQGPALSFDAVAVGEALAAARERLETAAEDARFLIDERDRVTLVPGRPAQRLASARVAEALLAACRRPERGGELPLGDGEPPGFSTEDARALRIERLVSTHTTRHPCCQPRVANIHRIADLVDGKLLRPGETLSLNELVGPRTRERGFVPAPAIEDGEMVDVVGGGVSQFATTYFNAFFHGGYDILERQPHSFYFSRYPVGHEATLSYPKPDVVIRNDTEAGVLVRAVYTKTSITVKLFGDNGGRKVVAKVSSRQDFVDPPLELLPNPKRRPDEVKVREHGSSGFSVFVARVLTVGDAPPKQERRKVTYKPRPRRVEVHPCKIPKGKEGHTGERCPEPEPEETEETEEASHPSIP